MSNDIKIPNLSEEDQKELATVESRAQLAMSKLSIATVQDANNAGTMAYELHVQIKKLDEIRKSMTRPLDDAKKKIKAFFDDPIARLEQAKCMLTSSIGTFVKKQKEANELFDEDNEIKIDNISVKRVWHWEITDFSKLPEEYKIPDTKKIDEMISALGKEGETIPGVNAVRKQQIAVRR